MTYLKPSNFFGKLFRWTAQCQSKTIIEQYQLGVRYFDLRLQWESPDSKPYFAHGLCKFKSESPRDVFNFLNNISDKDIYVRVGLETFKNCKQWERDVFQEYIEDLKRQFNNLKFQFFIKNPWEILENHFDKELIEIQLVPTWKNVLLGPYLLSKKYQEEPENFYILDTIIAGDFIV